jgi:hypothetical protein
MTDATAPAAKRGWPGSNTGPAIQLAIGATHGTAARIGVGALAAAAALRQRQRQGAALSSDDRAALFVAALRNGTAYRDEIVVWLGRGNGSARQQPRGRRGRDDQADRRRSIGMR